MTFVDGRPAGARGGGIATFAGLPWSQTLTEADVAVMGAPFDAGGAVRVGARYGPAAIRTQSMTCLRPFHRSGLSSTAMARCVDVGDAPVMHELAQETIEHIEASAGRILSVGLRLLTLGGDHATTLPLLRAARRSAGEPLAVVHFDAHQDVVDNYYDDKVKYNNGTVFPRAVEEGLIAPSRVIQLGMNGTLFRGMFPGESRSLGFTVVEAQELTSRSAEDVAQQVRSVIGAGPAYLTFDLDVFDVSVAPGTGAPECGGLTDREGLQLLRALSGIRLVAADVGEMNPLFDAGHMTAILAANVALELMFLLCNMHSEGTQ